MLGQEITIEIKNVYGEDKAYPVCDKAKLFTDIAGTKTLRPCDLNYIQQLGYKITVEQRRHEIKGLTKCYADTL